MRLIPFAMLAIALLSGCGQGGITGSKQQVEAGSLVDARRGFPTKLVNSPSAKTPAPQPPPKVFSLVRYDSPVGKLTAYVTPDPKDGKKHPAIIWITGGDSNTIDELWNEGPAKNDQTASAYRKAGIVTMFPSLRGGNDNPGQRESFFGEVDDILAAREFLAKQEYVDPARIYLGGHSTGGTLVLLVAECSEHQFRAVFSFGPVEDVEGYGPEYLHFDTSNRRELELRSPIRWLNSIKTPVFVFEGVRDGNLDSLQKLQAASTNPKLHFFPVRGADHFSVLSPLNRMIATRILNDTGATTNLAFTEADVLKAGK